VQPVLKRWQMGDRLRGLTVPELPWHYLTFPISHLPSPMEEFKVKGDKLKDKLKELIREGNVRRIVLKNPKGRVLLDMPLNAGVVGFALAPFWAAVAAVAVLATDYTVAVERDKTTAVTKPPETKT
jgi:hypothetical protein